MSDYNLGTARGTIELDYNGKGSASKAEGDLKRVEDSSKKSNEQMGKVGTGALVAGAGIVAGFAVAVGAAAKFEKGMSGIQAVSGASTKEMETVRKKALQLGADTAFSASDAGSAIEELVKAGISIPDVMNGAADATVSLAAAGGVALPEAATIAANAMNQFGLSAADMPNIANKIAGAANTSAIDVSDFGQSMTQVGAVAHLTGLSFDDMAVAITAMGNAGIKGSDAGTSLKSFLSMLQPQTKKQTNLMKDLGLITADGGNQFFTAAGKIKPMSQIAGTLAKSLKGMSEEQKMATLRTVFGSDAIRAAAVIAGQGAAGMDKLSAGINKTKAADVAATRMKNLAGQTEQMKGSAETLAIQIGSMLIPIITKVLGTITGWINKFTSMSDGTRKAVVIIALFVAAALLIVGSIIKVVSVVTKLQKSMLLLNGTMLANPMFWIVIAIIALIAAIVLLYKNNETFRNFIDACWQGIKTAIKTVVDWIMNVAVPFIKNAWNTIVTGAQTLWAAIVGVWNAIWNAIATAVNAIKAVVVAVFSAIVMVITTYINIWRTIITTVLNFILGIWRAVWGLFGPLVAAVWGLIVALVQLYIYAVRTVITTVLNFILAIWNAVWNAVKGAAIAVWNAIYAVVSGAVNRVRAIVSAVMNAIRSVMSAIWNAIKSTVSTIWNAIYSAISGPLNRARSIVSSVANAIKSAISTAFNAAKSAAATAFNALSSAVGTAMDTARDKVSSIISTIKGFFSGAGSWLLSAGKAIIQGLIDGISNMVGNVTGAITSITDKIKGFLPGSPIEEGPLVSWNNTGIGGPGASLVDLLVKGIAGNVSALEEAFSGVSIGMPNVLAGNSVGATASASRTGVSRSAYGAPSPNAGALVGGDLVLQAAPNQSVESQFDSVMFRLRTTRGVG